MNIRKIMKQAQAIQNNMAQLQADLAKQTFTAQAADGKVQATVNGAGELVALRIDPAVVDPQDADFLASLILKTVQAGVSLAKQTAEAEAQKVTGGLKLPM